MSDNIKQILDSSEVAELLRCTPKTVEDQARRGLLPGAKFGDGWVFPLEALLRRVNELALELSAVRRGARPVLLDPLPPMKVGRSRVQPLPDLTKFYSVGAAA